MNDWMGLANDGGCGNDNGPQEEPTGWCSYCDTIWQECEFKLIDDRPACPECGDWLIFNEDETTQTKTEAQHD